MTLPSACWFRPAPWFILTFLWPQVLVAQQLVQMNYNVTLSAYAFRISEPIVTSDAYATLIDRNTGGQVRSQVILGHQLNDLTNRFLVYEGKFVSDDGSAHTSSGNMTGAYDACYDAKMAAHANAFNIHVGFSTEVQCMVVIEIEGPPPPPREYCPILLDLALNGFHLSGPDPAVNFDIDADGTLDHIAWTRAGEDDGRHRRRT